MAADRATLRALLLDDARRDPRIVAAAITGSAAAGCEDEWSDIDLAFAVDGPVSGPIEEWTSRMRSVHGALHHQEIRFGVWVYRSFLLPGPLQVDLAFVPAAEFRPLAPSFQLVFGVTQPPVGLPDPPADAFVGMAWLHAMHARSSIARGHLLQAEYMIGGLRQHTLALACLRFGLSTTHGRGYRQLPPEYVPAAAETLVRTLDAAELTRALRAALDLAKMGAGPEAAPIFDLLRDAVR
jgi:hypothetical protein